jgi:hypothetical protein
MITRWAHGELGDTKCPMPGMLMMVALDNLTAAAFAPASDVSASKLPEMRSVGMALATGSRMASGAAGTFQTSPQSSLKYPSRRHPPASPRSGSSEKPPVRRFRVRPMCRMGSPRDN